MPGARVPGSTSRFSTMKNTTRSAIAVLAAAAIAGCGPAPSSNYAEGPVAPTTAIYNRLDGSESALLREFKKIDPSISDVMMTTVDGRETVEIARTNDAGGITTWTMPPDDYASLKQKASQNGHQATNTDNGFDWSSALMGAATGALIGGVVGNMMASSNQRSFSSTSQYNGYRGISTSQRNAAIARREEERRPMGNNAAITQMQNQTTNAAVRPVTSGLVSKTPSMPSAPAYSAPSRTATAPAYSAPSRSYSAPSVSRSSSVSVSRGSVSFSG